MVNTALFLAFMVSGTFFLGVNDTLVRKVLRHNRIYAQILVAFDYLSTAAILLFILIIVGLPEFKPGVWISILVSSSLNIFALWAWYVALKREEASLISPLRLLAPPLTIVSGFILLGEAPGAFGVIGIFITLIGLWILLHSEASDAGQPTFSLRNIAKRPGVLLGILSAVSFAISLPFDKKGVLASSPIFMGALGSFIVGLGNFCILLFRQYRARTLTPVFVSLWKERRTAIWMPFVHSVGIVLTLAALPLALIAYGSSVKRLWSFWTVILSGRFLKEKNIKIRILATTIMLIGIGVTVFLG